MPQDSNPYSYAEPIQSSAPGQSNLGSYHQVINPGDTIQSQENPEDLNQHAQSNITTFDVDLERAVFAEYMHLRRQASTTYRDFYIHRSAENSQRLATVCPQVIENCLDKLVREYISTGNRQRLNTGRGLSIEDLEFLKIFLARQSIDNLRNTNSIRLRLVRHLITIDSRFLSLSD